jgi:uncharacterized integral membrane protein
MLKRGGICLVAGYSTLEGCMSTVSSPKNFVWFIRSPLACALLAGAVTGLVFVSLSELARWLAWEAEDPLAVFAIGFVVGLLSAAVGVSTDYGGHCDSSPGAGHDSEAGRGRSAC